MGNEPVRQRGTPGPKPHYDTAKVAKGVCLHPELWRRIDEKAASFDPPVSRSIVIERALSLLFGFDPHSQKGQAASQSERQDPALVELVG